MRPGAIDQLITLLFGRAPVHGRGRRCQLGIVAGTLPFKIFERRYDRGLRLPAPGRLCWLRVWAWAASTEDRVALSSYLLTLCLGGFVESFVAFRVGLFGAVHPVRRRHSPRHMKPSEATSPHG